MSEPRERSLTEVELMRSTLSAYLNANVRVSNHLSDGQIFKLSPPEDTLYVMNEHTLLEAFTKAQEAMRTDDGRPVRWL